MSETKTIYTAEDFPAEEESQNPQEQESASSGETAETPTSSTPLVFPDDEKVPEALRGRSAADVAATYQAAVTMAQNAMQQYNSLATAQATPSAPITPEFSEDDDLSDPNVFQRRLDAAVSAKVAPLQQQVQAATAAQLAQQALASNPDLADFQQDFMAGAQLLQQRGQAHLPEAWQWLTGQIRAANQEKIFEKRLEASKAPQGKPSAPTTETGGLSVDQDDSAERAEAEKMAKLLGVKAEDILKFT